MPRFQYIDKVLVLGSGAIKIAEAGEFDYSTSQCIKALKEEGIRTILVNPNIATIQTDSKLANKIYFLPVSPKYVAKVIEEERPDGILLGFGGQTALNCGVELKRMGILDKYGVKVLGTSVEDIETASDREKFKMTMIRAGLPVANSRSAYSLEEAKQYAKELGYPVMIRVAFTLGGKGGGIARDEEELVEIVERGLAHSLIREVLLEEYLGELKQIEYEVMRDCAGNAITICNMENVLGMRVHTGDNIVVAPSQTLTNDEYHTLREASIKVVQTIKVVGECNVQFALDSNTGKYYIIEINPRMSRSSALASKATGYPIAYMAAKLAIGYTLPELLNKITNITTAAFEPALDYLVLKIPRWDFEKFPGVDRRLRTQMKSVGEVMAIGRSFEEVLQKAIRMLDKRREGLTTGLEEIPDDPALIRKKLEEPDDEILFYVAKALKMGFSVEEISKLSRIDPWFIYKMKNIVDAEEELKRAKFESLEELKEKIEKAKKLGFSDKRIAECLSLNEGDVRLLRKKLSILPKVKQIDTLAAEWPAKTNYLYLTYNASHDDLDFTKKGRRIIILGSGPYRIGVSVEFDWATVNMIGALKNLGIEEVIAINCNPETVSTDYDISDKLYFEELTLERVLDIYEKESADGVIACVGGQTANNLVPKLAKYGVKILGTSYESIEIAENRKKFSELLDSLAIKQPPWDDFSSLEEILEFARKVGYPVIVRPSFVISGAAMEVAWTPSKLKQYLERAAKISPEYPVTVSKFIMGAKEVEVDAVSDGHKVIIGAVIEHIENAGVHSGDAIMVIPPITLDPYIQYKIMDITEKIARALKIVGPFNIQFLVKGDEVYVIECNLRSSRSMPYTSKSVGINLIEIAAEAIIKGRIEGDYKPIIKQYAVKCPQFSFMQLDKADPVLSVEMRSTGEVACFGETFYEAFIKALEASGFNIPLSGGILLSAGGVEYKQKLLPLAKKLAEMGYELYATEHTSEFLRSNGLQVETIYKVREESRKPNILDYLREGKIKLVINIPSSITLEKYSEMLEDEYIIRRKAVELNIPVVTRIETAYRLMEALEFLKSREITAKLEG